MAKDSAKALDQAVKDLKRLSSRGKVNAANYIRYLRLQEEMAATRELLEDPDILKALRRADRDLKAGKGKQWEDVRGSEQVSHFS